MNIKAESSARLTIYFTVPKGVIIDIQPVYEDSTDYGGRRKQLYIHARAQDPELARVNLVQALSALVNAIGAELVEK